MWKTHFESLLNKVTTDAHMQYVKECLNNTEHWCYDMFTTPCMVQNAIDKLMFGGASGNGGLPAGHFVHAYRHMFVLLSFFYNIVISHGHQPDNFMKAIIIPLIKTK